MKVSFANFLSCMFVFGILLTQNAHAQMMTLAEFKALSTAGNVRCVEGIKTPECAEELAYALEGKMIDQATHDWGKANGYYPIFRKRGEKIGGICKCGCFALGTRISVPDGFKAVEDVQVKDVVLALKSGSKLDSMQSDIKAVKAVTRGPEMGQMYEFELVDGTVLTVTQHHGMLLSSGKMVAAKAVLESDSFLNVHGESVEVKTIRKFATKGDVFNLETASGDNLNHIILAEDIFVGDLAWQNQLQKDLNAIQLRL